MYVIALFYLPRLFCLINAASSMVIFVGGIRRVDVKGKSLSYGSFEFSNMNFRIRVQKCDLYRYMLE